MITKKPQPHRQYQVQPQVFDAYDKETPIQQALGSERTQSKREQADIRSVNWVEGVSGWRLTPRGLELGNTSGVFPPGTVTFVDIQNMSTDKILGRDTAGSGVIEQLGLGTGLVISSANLTLSFTKAQLDGLVSDGNVLYVGDVTQYTDEQAQDAVGNALGAGLSYNDGTGAISTTLTLAAGTYTPTDTAHANLTGTDATMTEAQYMRVGATVTVSGRFTAEPTLTATTTSFEITLPVASNIGAVEDIAGVAFCGNIVSMGAEVIGVVANDTAKIQWKSTDITSQSWSYTFSYQII